MHSGPTGLLAMMSLLWYERPMTPRIPHAAAAVSKGHGCNGGLFVGLLKLRHHLRARSWPTPLIRRQEVLTSSVCLCPDRQIPDRRGQRSEASCIHLQCALRLFDPLSNKGVSLRVPSGAEDNRRFPLTTPRSRPQQAVHPAATSTRQQQVG